MQDDTVCFSTGFLGGGPFTVLPFLLFMLISFTAVSSFLLMGGFVLLSLLVFLGRPLPLTGALFFATLLALLFCTSESDSELLSGEKMLFFFRAWPPDFEFVGGLELDLGADLLLLSVDERGAALVCLDVTVAVAFDFADDRLLGGAVLAGGGLGVSSSLEEEILVTVEGRLLFSSFFLVCWLLVLVSSSLVCFAGDLGPALEAGAAGVSDVDESESELLEPDPELDDELPLLLESEDDPELLSELLLLA